ncbi:MAG: DNA methyltransferase [Chloroflexota bacterium]|nr:DNA methyltransferase [Chloroflexota bacterium]
MTKSIARHHAEWLSLLEISGPFLSMPVLIEAFPQGLEARDAERAGELRAAYEEWADNQGGLQPDPAIHTAWVRYVLENTLDLEVTLAKGQAIPDGIKARFPEYGEVIRPDLMVVPPLTSPPLGGTEGGMEGQPRLLIQVHPAGQSLDKALPNRPWKASAAMRMMELLRTTEVRLGLLTNGDQWMLVHARRGETTTFVSWYAGLWLEEPLTLRAFHTLLGAKRFFNVPDDQTLESLLEASAQDQHEVTDQLGHQVRQAIEILIQAIDKADQDRGRTLLAGISEDRVYEAALTVMMRLVFLLSAEERGLLLLGDPVYDQHYAVSTLRAQLREMADQQGEEVLERRFDAWCRLLVAFRAVYDGVQHENLRLPAYGGSLFDPDRFPFLEGRVPDTHWRTTPADPLPINNRTVMHLLDALQILQVKVPGGGPAEARRLSFRALDIEQIGHVYEGLLDHIAVRATEPVLGLVGTKRKEPEIPLPELEAQQTRGQVALVEYLQDQTGRSASALRRALEPGNVHATRNTQHASRLRAACGNDDTLYQRVLPFAGLVRDDDYSFPVVIPAGSVYVTAGPTRRATGTHYTPRSLTEPIVQHTLEPLVYVGPAEGQPREEWQLRSPAELLDLKICDMAMGSGAFLVQACRYLSERLVEAWEQIQTPSVKRQTSRGKSPVSSIQLRITPEGEPATGDPGETIIPQDADERLTLARRLVVDRCLYGVDKNPLAVEMAKLSLWLITLDKHRSFTFLDHALRHGDSLIGADEDMFLRWSHTVRGSAMPLFDEENRKALEAARAKRRELQSFEVRDVYDAERKAHLLAEAEAAMARIKQGCNVLVGARLLDDLSQTERDALLEQVLIDYTAGEPLTDEDAQRAVAAARKNDAFHWPFEFPEVFEKGGFGAFIGNPPFMRGKSISTNLGRSYLKYLKIRWDHRKGSADYSAYFFLRGFANLRHEGTLGLISTNTIAQGDTREVGLDFLADQGAQVYRALNDYSWPGQAAVTVNIVHLAKGMSKLQNMLDGEQVDYISSLLDSQRTIGNPYRLAQNSGKSHMGSIVLGTGFTLRPEEAHDLIAKDPRNADVLFPYLRGQDLNSTPDQAPSFWVINFFDWSLEEAEQYPDCMEIIREKVYPERQEKKGNYAKLWWQYGRRQEQLYEAVAPLPRVLFHSFTSKYLCFGFVPTNIIYAGPHVVMALSEWRYFAILQSSLHEHWARKYGSTLETRLRYAASDVFETFPFPYLAPEQQAILDNVGETYHEHRRQIMLDRQEGLTKTYNRFHDPDEAAADIARLRELHVEMDYAVAAAYGWEDLDLSHGFHETRQGLRFTISDSARREVLTRLLHLNHERYAEEIRQGLHEKKTERGSRKGGTRKKAVFKKKDERQMELL